MQRVVNEVPGGIIATQENIVCQLGKTVQVIADLTSSTPGKRVFKALHKFQPLSVENNNFSKFAKSSGDPQIDQLVYDLRQQQIEPSYGSEKMACDVCLVPDPPSERTYFETSL